MAWQDKILHHLTFPHSRNNYDKLHYTVKGWSILTFWKYCPSLFKLLFSIQMDQKRWFANITSKITGSNSTGLLPLGLCEEYYLPGKNCRSLKSATWHEWWLQQWLKLCLWTHGETEYYFGMYWTINGAHVEVY